MTAIIDYGAGNLFSVKNALDHIGCDSVVTKDAAELEKADRIILPGVGAFPDAMKALGETGLIPVIKEQAKKKKNSKNSEKNILRNSAKVLSRTTLTTCIMLMKTETK